MRDLSLILSVGAIGALAMVGCGGNVVLDSGSEGGVDGGGGTTTGTTSSPCGGALPTQSSLVLKDPESGWRTVYLSMSYAGSCGQPQGYPPDCDDATVVSLIIAPLTPTGTYAMDGTSSLVFGNVDTQYGSSGGCGLMATSLAGTVVLTAIDDAHVAGAVCDPALSGTFDATACAACFGTGADCVSDVQCCNNFCDPAYHVCQP